MLQNQTNEFIDKSDQIRFSEAGGEGKGNWMKVIKVQTSSCKMREFWALMYSMVVELTTLYYIYWWLRK